MIKGFVAISASIITILSSGNSVLVNTFLQGKTTLPKLFSFYVNIENDDSSRIAIDKDREETTQEPVQDILDQCFIQLAVIDTMLEQTIRPIERAYASLKMACENGLIDNLVTRFSNLETEISELYLPYYNSAFNRLCRQREELINLYQKVEDKSIFDTPIEKQYELLRRRFDFLSSHGSYCDREALSKLKQDINNFKNQLESEIPNYSNQYYEKRIMITEGLSNFLDTARELQKYEIYRPWDYYLQHPETIPPSDNNSNFRGDSGGGLDISGEDNYQMDPSYCDLEMESTNVLFNDSYEKEKNLQKHNDMLRGKHF